MRNRPAPLLMRAFGPGAALDATEAEGERLRRFQTFYAHDAVTDATMKFLFRKSHVE